MKDYHCGMFILASQMKEPWSYKVLNPGGSKFQQSAIGKLRKNTL
jgi:hypothetical protein